MIEFDLSRADYSIVENETIAIDAFAQTLKGKGRKNKEDREYLKKLMHQSGRKIYKL